MTGHITVMGVRADGAAVACKTALGAGDFLHEAFLAGWRSATATDANGTILGEILTGPESGERIWWARGVTGADA